jgi:hypothetical protein
VGRLNGAPITHSPAVTGAQTCGHHSGNPHRPAVRLTTRPVISNEHATSLLAPEQPSRHRIHEHVGEDGAHPDHPALHAAVDNYRSWRISAERRILHTGHGPAVVAECDRSSGRPSSCRVWTKAMTAGPTEFERAEHRVRRAALSCSCISAVGSGNPIGIGWRPPGNRGCAVFPRRRALRDIRSPRRKRVERDAGGPALFPA